MELFFNFPPWGKKPTIVYFDVLDLGSKMKNEYHSDLHYYRTERKDWGPSGIIYWGGISKGWFKSVDYTKIQVHYDPSRITMDEIRNFLIGLGIKLK